MPTTEVLIDTLIHLRQDPRGLNLDQFCQILERFRADLVNQAFVILGNQEDAEDVAQETFSQAFTHLDQLREPAKISAWLRGINRNLAMNLRHRHFNAREERLTTGQASSVPAPRTTTVSTGIVRAQDHVMSAVDSLPQPFREVLVMRYWEKLGHEEIAERLGLPLGTVWSRTARANRMLARKLNAILSQEKHPQ